MSTELNFPRAGEPQNLRHPSGIELLWDKKVGAWVKFRVRNPAARFQRYDTHASAKTHIWIQADAEKYLSRCVATLAQGKVVPIR